MDIDSVVGRVYFAVFLVVTMVGQVGKNIPAIVASASVLGMNNAQKGKFIKSRSRENNTITHK